jgi:hypothetical protein
MGEGPMGFHFDQLGYDGDSVATHRKSSPRREHLTNSIDFHTQQAMKSMEQLRKLENMSDEPDNNPAILYFEKWFPASRKYSYAAIKAGSKWYLTGKNTKAYTWEELWEFLSTGVDEVWLVTDLELLN